jgi:mannose-6-phosphate isomerase-like protein (cupin superfamily)
MGPVSQTVHLRNRHNGESLQMTRGVENGHEVLYLEGRLPPHNEGPPMHIHVDQDESVEVVSGRLSATVDGKTITLGAGERGFIPRGVRHRWWNTGDEPLALRGKAEPAGDLDQFLEGMFRHPECQRERPAFALSHRASVAASSQSAHQPGPRVGRSHPLPRHRGDRHSRWGLPSGWLARCADGGPR